MSGLSEIPRECDDSSNSIIALTTSADKISNNFTTVVTELLAITEALGDLYGSGSGPIALDTRNDESFFYGIWRDLQDAQVRFQRITGTSASLTEACMIASELADSPTRTTTQIRNAASAIICLIDKQLTPYHQ